MEVRYLKEAIYHNNQRYAVGDEIEWSDELEARHGSHCFTTTNPSKKDGKVFKQECEDEKESRRYISVIDAAERGDEAKQIVDLFTHAAIVVAAEKINAETGATATETAKNIIDKVRKDRSDERRERDEDNDNRAEEGNRAKKEKALVSQIESGAEKQQILDDNDTEVIHSVADALGLRKDTVSETVEALIQNYRG